jgi:hypothetical protein
MAVVKTKTQLTLPSLDDSKKDVSKFKSFRKGLASIYGGDIALNYLYDHRSQSNVLFNVRKREDLQRLLEQSLGQGLSSRIGEVSRALFNVDPNYAKLIRRFVNMFFIRYTIIPVLTDYKNKNKKEINDEEYLNIYHSMVEVADGMSLEILIPEILEELLISGSVYLTALRNSSSNTIAAIILPNQYCRTVLKTNLGTNLIQFNFEYFDLFQSAEDREKVLSYFPKEFSTLYQEFLINKQDSWKQLDPKYSTSILVNDKGIPPFISAMDGIFEFDRIRAAEVIKSENQLKKILTHKIPTTTSGELIFDLDEIRDIHRAVRNITQRHAGLDVITVFGETKLLTLQDEASIENKSVIQGYQSIFHSAGVNSEIFMGKSDQALLLNHQIDKGFVWKFIVEINNYVNLIINQLFNFRPFQAEINLLPITLVEEANTIQRYRENASFGIGKLEAVVATGMKQKHFHDKAKLEEVLDLDHLLKPLQSSHTQGGDKEGDVIKDEETTNSTPSNDEPSEEETKKKEVKIDE